MQKSLNKTILALAIPAIIANITTPLLSLVDLAIVGHLGSAAFVAAIAVGGTVCNMLYWLFGFLRTGTSGLTAQAYGAEASRLRPERGWEASRLRPERGWEASRLRMETDLIGLRSTIIALALGILIVILKGPLIKLSLWILYGGETPPIHAASYLNIVLWGAPAVLMQFSLTGWFIGMQNTRTPMIISLVINVSNIAASLLLVYVFDLGIRGVAIGTLSAQWIGVICGWVASRLRIADKPGRQIFNWQKLRRFFSINADIFLRTLCLIGVTVWFTRAGAAQGDVMLAVNTLLLQFFTLFSYFMDGFAFAGEALCGKYFGANDFLGLKNCVKALMRWGIILALIATAIYGLGGEAFLHLLTSDADIVRAAEPFRLWAVAIPLAGFMAFTADGIAIGLTRTRAMLGSMAVASAAYFALYFLLTPALGNHALWLAFVAYLALRGLLLTALLRMRQGSSAVKRLRRAGKGRGCKTSRSDATAGGMERRK